MYFKKRIRLLFDLLKFVYSNVVYANFFAYWKAVILGGFVRCFHILSFVLILQMLVMAILPNNKKAELLAQASQYILENYNININLSPVLIVGIAVLLVTILSIVFQYFYQKLCGRIIIRVDGFIGDKLKDDKAELVSRLKTATTLCTTSIKIAEIIGFMSVLILVIGLISVPVLGICLLLCGLAVIALILISPRRLRMKKDISDSREAYEKDKSAQNYERFLESSELLRFRNQFTGALEMSVVGIATILFVIIIQLENIELSDVASYEILFLVFAIRYAFAYMRELSRNIGQLLDLRTSFVN